MRFAPGSGFDCDDYRKLNRPLVSIGMPFYNPGALLEDAVRSVFAQTFHDWELILLDDGSTDASVAFARRLVEPRVRICSDGKNLGLAVRLNEVSDLARGDYVVRMDADDMMAPTRLQEQVAFLAANRECDVVGTQAFVLNGQNSVVGARRIKRENFVSAARCLRHGMVIHPTIMARRDWFRQNRYDPDFVRAEDRELFARVLKKPAVGHLDRLLHFYRVPSTVRLQAFLQGYHSERRVLRRYGPSLLGWPRTWALLLNSFARSVLLPILVKAGLQSCVVRRLQGRGALSHKDEAAGNAILKHISETPIPMRG